MPESPAPDVAAPFGEPVAQQRLQGLLRAGLALTGDLSLSVVLQRLVDSASELVGARYGALGILDETGTLDELITTGMTEHERAAITRFPLGLGVLSLAGERPVRIPDIGADPSSVGFPAGHPPMSSFLGVPIRVRGATFGMLYLAKQADGGEFSAEDEDLAVALATTAATAIQNARLYEQARSRERWLQVSVEITNALLLGTGDPLDLITERSRESTGSDLAVISVASASGYRIAAAAGTGADKVRGGSYSIEDSLTNRVVQSAAPQLVDHMPHVAEFEATTRAFGPAMALPLIEHDVVRGAMVFTRLNGQASFTEADLAAAASFADHAALALHLADAQLDRERLTLLEDRTRIARDLHDNVIQRLFATGLGLQRLADRSQGEDAVRMAGHVADLDETIRQIRQTIFRLQTPDDSAGIRSRILDLVAQVSPLLGFSPSVRVAPAVDVVLSAEAADETVPMMPPTAASKLSAICRMPALRCSSAARRAWAVSASRCRVRIRLSLNTWTAAAIAPTSSWRPR